MTHSTGENHQFLKFSTNQLTQAEIDQLASTIPQINGDLIIDVSSIESADKALVASFIDTLEPVMEENIIILVGDEDGLEELGFLAEEFPVTPTYNEAMDFLFMLQLEKDLGDEE